MGSSRRARVGHWVVLTVALFGAGCAERPERALLDDETTARYGDGGHAVGGDGARSSRADATVVTDGGSFSADGAARLDGPASALEDSGGLAADSSPADSVPPIVDPNRLDWLEDQPPTQFIRRTLAGPLAALETFPRVSTGSLRATPPPEQLACFDLACVKAFGGALERVAAAQAINPDLVYLRILCPQEWQGASEQEGRSGNGMPFSSTGPISGVPAGQMFAGHFLYKAGTTLRAGLGATSRTVAVADATRLTVGQYAVIYDAPAGRFANAEHVRIDARDTSATPNTVTVTRAYRSTASGHAAGSIIAQHQLGNGSANTNWAYNMSTRCPLDGAGKQLWQVLSEWFGNNYDRNALGEPMATANGVRCGGILYDSDFFLYIAGGTVATRDCDADNDLAADWGVSGDGDNWWGDGFELFYNNVRTVLDRRGPPHDSALLLGGTADAMGLEANSGTQLESFPDGVFAEDGSSATEYTRLITSYINDAKLQRGWGEIAPRVSDAQNKTATRLYGGGSSNAPYRFAMALSTALGDFTSSQNYPTSAYDGDDTFRYWEEWAVDVTPGSAHYGEAIAKTDTAAIRQHRHWLGKPLGPYRRVYDPALFARGETLVQGGDMEALSLGWTGAGAAVSRVTHLAYQGTASLQLTPTTPGTRLGDASATGPRVALVSGREYTLVFVARASGPRATRVYVGQSSSGTILLPGEAWSKQVFTFRATSDQAAAPIRFECGAQDETLWIDQLYLFEGNANVFRRDFEHGVVLANATPTPKTLDLGGSYLRIRGAQDPAVNSGALISGKLTLPAWDGLFLVRP